VDECPELPTSSRKISTEWWKTRFAEIFTKTNTAGKKKIFDCEWRTSGRVADRLARAGAAIARHSPGPIIRVEWRGRFRSS
jgi:hypothetical protein